MKKILTPEQNLKLLDLGIEYNKTSHLSDLLSILPKKITDRRYIYTLEMGAWNTEDDGWYIKYVNDMDNDTLESYQEAEELCDAIFNMIVWLKETPNLVWL